MIDCIDYNELRPAANSCVRNFVNLEKGEKVLIITDKPVIAEVLAEASKKAGGEVSVFYLARAMRPMGKLGKILKSMILESQVVFTPFDAIEEEVDFRREIVSLAGEGEGRKIAHMPSVTPTMFGAQGMLNMKAEEMKKMESLTEKVAVLLTAAMGTQIKSALHEEKKLFMDLGGWDHSGIVSTGRIKKGSWGNLPSGEAFVLPKKATASGSIVIDMAISGVPSNTLPVTLEITNDIINLESIKNGNILKKFFERYKGSDVRSVCELGIGTNPKHPCALLPIEIEKILRTIHIGFGNNTMFGGDINSKVPHTDMVTCRPIIEIGKLQNRSEYVTIIQDGNIQEDLIDTYFKISHATFSERFSDTSKINIIPMVNVVPKDDRLFRHWTDYRGHELSVQIGDADTAKKANDIWGLIRPEKKNTVADIISKFSNKFRGKSELGYQLLKTLEVFGIIRIGVLDKPERG